MSDNNTTTNIVKTKVNFYTKSNEPERVYFFEAIIDVETFKEISRTELGYVNLLKLADEGTITKGDK
jgi:hypothetical protein